VHDAIIDKKSKSRDWRFCALASAAGCRCVGGNISVYLAKASSAQLACELTLRRRNGPPRQQPQRRSKIITESVAPWATWHHRWRWFL